MKNKIFHPYTPFSNIEKGFLNIVRGEGIYLFDDQGNKYVDIVSSWWAVALGHGHPKIVKAIQEQAGILQHSITGSLTHPTVLELAERLAGLMPTPDRHSVFASDGCSAVEAALKVAIQYWYNVDRPDKTWIIGMDQGYHGDSMGALGAGFVDDFHKPFERAVSHPAKLPFPIPTEDDPDGFLPSQTVIEQHKDKLAAVIVEPLCLGSAGMRMYSAGYLKQLADCCAENDVLLIVDEVAMGFGRTGKRFAFNHANIDPDLVCMGKGLTAGYMPLSACVVKDSIYDTFTDKGEKDCTFYHGNTFAGHPIGCAAALAALDIYEAEGTVERGAEMAEKMKQWMLPMAKLECVEELRFLGMIGVVQLKPETKPCILKIKQALFEQGYLFRPLGTMFYLMPPLVITDDELRGAVSALQQTIEEFC
ncbi:adenosylmethionine--8-amino-7-oxononanoate transaminase [Pontiella sulfatireligans]|uniref:Adenosylmethionine-8-amino-7-oxononanoate aminotransferase n=1 Tax=Pontiella sulfatireligans TaxID=2750658 RepID=A0A6C2US26_9BACT|nr:adenosylmethionine--8-amino-7-oxononanoate transaminase [Pontiella sulfatireligans]VGO22064.1 Adenosylmethionine-8-amino-7-oxononanoate aminotransferase [Pontiella sulfatireligans]